MPQDRSAHIDSLRAVAALLVVWIHGSELFAPLDGGSDWHDIALRYDFGRIGVVAFFGVSGLLVPSSLRGDRHEPGVLASALAVFWVATPAACSYAVLGHGSHNPFFVRFPVSYGAGVALFL